MKLRDLLPKPSPDDSLSWTNGARRFAAVLSGLATLALFAVWDGRESLRSVWGLATSFYVLSFFLGWWGNRIEPYREDRTRRAVLNTLGSAGAALAIYLIFTALD